jgi:hypothetical protein
MKKLVWLLFTFVACAAHAEDSPLAAALKAHRMTLRLDGGKLTGAGADFLLDEGRRSQFFLIGEDHGGAESSRFALAVFQALEPAGYHHIAVEAGPITAKRLHSLGSVEAIGRLNVAHPFALPFFNWREEAEFLVGTKADVWGLDQEFVLSPAIHLERLAELAATPEAKKAVAAWVTRNVTANREMTEQHNPGAVLMMAAKPEEFEALAAVFPKGGEAARIIGELRESAAIYQLWAGDHNYDSNLTRSQLMKRHFREYYDRAVANGEKQPRVLLKFGMFHMMRGRSFTNVHDLGSMLPELATQNGSGAFSVVLLYRRGHVNQHTPFSSDASDKAAEYDPIKSRNLDFDPSPLFDAADTSDWTLYDLRALRPMMGKKMPVEDALARIVWGYDALIVIPEIHPATLFE